ncbi:extracellular solute-binding protein [Cohnella sp. LGH]|uniref:Extracellular solute-binding protein n=1 Tax=Cohnella phaseoli TaxID=456490 RepID=A0A3D9IMD1_9BACL|nr:MULTISPECIES: extracellular solute-binding protein [Cohnella]QTH42653.1 extracellular solute-binding protein [Cohnella sp. LGH]RED62934.1 extracellular solute-binding protein [Cohnella phaseoli]
MKKGHWSYTAIALIMALSTVLGACSSGGNKENGATTGGDASNVPETSQASTAPANTGDSGPPIKELVFPAAFPEVPKAVDASSYAYDDLSKKYELDLMVAGAFNQPVPEDTIKAYLEEKFNVSIKFSSMTGEDLKNAVSVRYASGSEPDLVMFSYKDVARSLFESGQLLDAKEILPYMPQTMEYVTQDYAKWATVDGNMIGIPRYPVFPNNWGYFIRQDWLQKLNMSMPTNEDELFAYAKAVVEKDPDGNGKPDTWFMATAGGGNGWSMMDALKAMYGHPSWNVVDGKLNHPMLDGTTKRFLEFVKKLYDNKLLAPDWYTIGWEPFKAYSLNDQIGMVWYPGWNIIDEQYNAKKKDANAVNLWAPIQPLKSNDGKGGMYGPGDNPGGIFIISKKVANDPGKMKRLAHLIDSMMYPNVNYWAVSQGGGPEIYPGESRVQLNEDGTNVFAIAPTHVQLAKPEYQSLADWQFFGYSLIWQVYDDEPVGVLGSKYNQEIIAMPRYKNFDMNLTLDGTTSTKIADFQNKNEISFVLGKRSLDEWDSYVEEWKKAGGQKLIDEAVEQLQVSKP